MSHDFPSSGELAGHRNPYLSADPGGVMVWGCDRARGHTGMCPLSEGDRVML